jgi:TM2 domain-containing membrane protein YozV
VGDWYYIGHYGQLGPLTRDQIDELIAAEVIARETYVWKTGMTDWVPAGSLGELGQKFFTSAPAMDPPPPPGPSLPRYSSQPNNSPVYASYPPGPLSTLKSDKSRLVGGILQLVIPGVGRMYLGYGATGVLQLVFSLCGVGLIWSYIDGIYILAGGIKHDGYGRRLGE